MTIQCQLSADKFCFVVIIGNVDFSSYLKRY